MYACWRWSLLICSPAIIFGCAGERTTTTSQDLATSREALTSCVNFTATADATLSYSEMRQNLGAKKVLRAGEKDESVLAFNLGSIPQAAAIDSATLKLYVSDADSNKAINIHRVTTAWAESTVTFASFAQHFNQQIVGSIDVKHDNVQKSVDLTALAVSWITGAQPNYGVLLESAAREETTFVSREGGTAEQKPTLRVCYTTPDNHCTPNPCLNGSTCENNASGFVCHCAAGYTDTTCGTNINDCASSPCQNGGTCTDGVNSYSCACTAGFTGTHCETNIDDCAVGPCQNGGVCEDGVASYTCHCPAGYTGSNCETLIDNCASQPCQNAGTCANEVNSYICACATGFAGTNCEINIDDCVNQPCHNGGTCIDGVNGYTCVCPPDWGGIVCDVNLNTCSQNPCLNGSTCTNGFGNYTCACAAGFTGTNCEIDVNDCAPNPCQNGGVCVDGLNAFTCSCAAGFSGSDCAEPACAEAVDGGSCTPATLTLTPGSNHDFGDVAVAVRSSYVIAVQNTGELATPGGVIARLGGADATEFAMPATTCGAVLLPGASCTIEVAFAPTTLGAKSGSLTIIGGAMAPNAIQLTGNGVEPALLSLSPSAPVSLGGVLIGTIGGSQVFTVSNAIGHATTGPITVSLGGDVSDFSLVANDCTQLSAGTSCTFELRFNPAASGAFGLVVTVAASPGGTQSGLIRATGECPTGFRGTSCDVEIDHCAPNPCQHGGVCVNSLAGYSCTCASGFLGTNCQNFVCTSAPNGAPCDDGSSCTTGDTCQSGSCVGNSAVVCSASDSCHDPGVCDPQTGTCSNPVKTGGTCTPATLTLTPSQAHDFGVVTLGSKSQAYTITVQNTGEVTTSSSVSATLSGADSVQFTLGASTCTAALAPGAECTLVATFVPFSTGAKSATITFTAGGAAPRVETLAGTGE